MSKPASETGNCRYANPPSVEPPKNPLASRIERAPRDQIPYEDIVSMMKELAEHIRELEQNIEEIRGAGEQDQKKDRDRVRSWDDQHQYQAQRYDEGRSSRGND